MNLKNSQYQAIMRQYDLRQMEHRHQQTLRYEELCNKLPAYRDLEDQIAALYADRARAAVLGQAVQLQDMLQQIQTLQHQQRILMTRAGYPSDYLALTYTCPDCHDTGFIGEEKCQTPHLTEEEIKARFLDAFNALVSDKERLLDECRTMQAALTDTGSLDSEIAALLSEMEVVAELTKRCIEENSTTAQDQAAYLERYNGLAERYETAKAKLEKLQAAKAQREAKAEDIGGFMFELAEYGESLTEFDEGLWLTVIDTVTVHRDGQLTFKFQTGHEMLE